MLAILTLALYFVTMRSEEGFAKNNRLRTANNCVIQQKTKVEAKTRSSLSACAGVTKALRDAILVSR